MKDEQMSTVLNDYFLSVFTKEDVENVPIPQQMFHGTENDQLLDIVIKKDVVQQKLEELNCNKSQGPDEIHPRLLKELSSVIAEPLLKGIANLDYSLFFKLSGDSKVRGHTYKIFKIIFAGMLGKISLVIEWWMHVMSCLNMWLMHCGFF